MECLSGIPNKTLFFLDFEWSDDCGYLTMICVCFFNEYTISFRKKC